MSSLRQISLSKLSPLAGLMDRWKRILEKNPSLKSLSEKMSPERKFSLGIDLGTHALRYVLLDPSRAEVLDYGSVVFDAPPRSKQGEEKKEVRPLAAILKDLVKKLPRTQISHCAINLQDLSVVTGNLQLPTASGRDPHLVRLAIQDQISFPIEDAGYLCTESKALDSGRSLFSYTAVPRKVIEKLIDPVDEALAIVPDVNLEGHALESLVKTMHLAGPKEITAFLNVGRSMTIVSIFQGSKLLFERHIPLGGQDMTRAIFIMYLAGQSPRTGQDLEQAEKVKRECYLPIPPQAGKKAVSRERPPEKPGLTEEENHKLFKVIDGLLAAWVQDIRLSFHFFNENYSSEPISQVYLIGGGSNLKNFDAYLGAELGIPTQILSFPNNGALSFSPTRVPETFRQQFHEFAPALAFALKPEGHATLTPKEYKTLVLEQMARSIIRTGSIVLFFFLLVWYLFLVVQNQHLTAIKTTFLKNRGLMERAEGPYLAMRRWENFLKDIDLPRPQASVLLKVLSQKIPSNMLLARIAIQREQGTLLIEGIVMGDAKRCAVTLSEFSKSLEDSGYFKQIQIPSLNRNVAERDSSLFQLTARLAETSGGTL